MTTHEHYMSQALKHAKKAAKDGETPVGCIVIDPDGIVIGHGRNRRERKSNATAHAEIEAIADACNTLCDWRLSGCSIYVTLEPCPMCAGAIMMSRIDKVYYGARDEQTGSCGSVINLFMEPYGHPVQITGGILEDECSKLMSAFFKDLRE